MKKENNQFVEGLMFNLNRGVIMTGNMVNSAEPGKVYISKSCLKHIFILIIDKMYFPFQLNIISRWFKPWFFKHVESFLDVGTHVEYIPLRDYFHRHSRSIFWEIQVSVDDKFVVTM